ncbi:16S rRNA (adenine(1518)-N(6)/adenine(1519)-N(6))-dimethyltransferase RsmA [Flexithrix dorotheae]|uniref:16S rRNA (adenine(1518)-N(6)/adenine(1519)-N(6))- dimethyltransferase RsmA n=1 Tax=Flexithrix dorotheae TaxID=70993 RepID=UPI00037F429C|nr:16S rRNA (adenine(1518)-N(6)/adenine(1519)-N(6))-dimethyltransferase RsmA [Flexithrix dorotheae]
MGYVRPKKKLGQHFLKDNHIAERIVKSLTLHNGYTNVLEIGPGTGVLTRILLKDSQIKTKVVEIDRESVTYLKENFELKEEDIISGDFLRMQIDTIFPGKYGIIGNFPYNISSQIFFKILEYRNTVEEIVCMLQKEVAERINAGPGGKTSGILSILLQAYYDIEYLFTVPPEVFNPPPKVQSGVISLKRNDREKLGCDEKLFARIVKQGFNNRRKTLRNALKSLGIPKEITQDEIYGKRAEALSVDQFIDITKNIEEGLKE